MPRAVQLGIFSRTFSRPDLAAALDAVVSNGFQLVHLSLHSAGVDPFRTTVSFSACAAIRRELDIRELSVAGVSCTFNAIHPDRSLRARETASAAELILIVPELGANFASLSTGTRDAADMWRAHPANQASEAWSDLRETIERLLESAMRANVTLGIEPELGNVVSSAERARRLLDEFADPRLRIIFDPSNLLTISTVARQEEILGDALGLLAPDIEVVHAKDFSETGPCAAGRGFLNFELLFEQLEDRGVQVPAILHELPEADVSRARDHVLTAARRASARTSSRSSTHDARRKR